MQWKNVLQTRRTEQSAAETCHWVCIVQVWRNKADLICARRFSWYVNLCKFVVKAPSDEPGLRPPHFTLIRLDASLVLVYCAGASLAKTPATRSPYSMCSIDRLSRASLSLLLIEIQGQVSSGNEELRRRRRLHINTTRPQRAVSPNCSMTADMMEIASQLSTRMSSHMHIPHKVFDKKDGRSF